MERATGRARPSSEWSGQANPPCNTMSCDGEPKIVGEAIDFTLPRKAAGEDEHRPYRKPTQVVGKRILR